MRKVTDREALIARLILSTRRKKRTINVIAVAEDILALQKLEGNLKAVTELIGIERDMLNRILSVKKLNKEVQKMFQQKKIDSFFVAYYLKRFNQADQLKIAKEVVTGKINSIDVRALGPLRTHSPNAQIEDLISRLKKSKTVKVSVAYIQIPNSFNKEVFIEKIKKLIGKDHFISFLAQGQLGTLKVTKEAEQKLKMIARSKNISLKELIYSIIH